MADLSTTENSLEQVGGILDECTTVLDIDDSEDKNLEAAVSDLLELPTLLITREKVIKEEIANLISLEAEEEEKLRQTVNETVEEELKQLQAQVETSKSHKSEVTQQLEEKNIEMKRAENELARLAEERLRVKLKTTESVPKLRYKTKLYENITQLRWNYDTAPDEIKGYLHNKEKVVPISLNSKQHSHYFIANYLWDLMEPDW